MFHFQHGSVYEGIWHQGMRQGFGLMRLTPASHAASVSEYQALQALTPRQKQAKKLARPPPPFTTPMQPRVLSSPVDSLDPSGWTYQGEYERDRRNGDGVITWGQGSTYMGEWVSDVRCGKVHYIAWS